MTYMPVIGCYYFWIQSLRILSKTPMGLYKLQRQFPDSKYYTAIANMKGILTLSHY